MNKIASNIRKYLLKVLLLGGAICTLNACQQGWSLSPPSFPSPQISHPTRTPALPDTFGTASSATEHLLGQMHVPESDPRDLAIRLRPDILDVPLVVNEKAPNYTVGDQLEFWVLNGNTQETNQITAELIHKTSVVYAWVEVGPSYNRDVITEAVEHFSTQTYPAVVSFFGSEWNPGVDNDPRLHVLHTLEIGDAAGYFSHADEYSQLVNPYSNEKEIFYISLEVSNDDDYGKILAHEFQHMIHWHHDRNEIPWVDEGLSEYAAEVAGFGVDTAFIREFISQPDTQLTAWGEGTPNHYGASYLFMKYLHQRFGSTLLSVLVAQPANGVAGLQQAFAQLGITQDFDALFADWVIANYANQPDALDQGGRYGYHDFHFGKPRSVQITIPNSVDSHKTTVSNYATDYYRLKGQGDVTAGFSGQSTTQLTAVSAFSGSYGWWSNRADGSDTQLTRMFDLRSVAAGVPIVMEVAMWWEIEEHYDYGYVLASRDGHKWDILPSRHTTVDNPTGNSFGPAYTGRYADSTHGALDWKFERFDLSAYAGNQIWVRFEYVTDEAITSSGWSIDDVRIPAIRYATDFEHGPDGWESNGWLLTDNQLIQHWLLQVMEFDGDELVDLHCVEVDATGQAKVEITNLSKSREAVLAISALAPTTIPGQYEVTIIQNGDK